MAKIGFPNINRIATVFLKIWFCKLVFLEFEAENTRFLTTDFVDDSVHHILCLGAVGFLRPEFGLNMTVVHANCQSRCMLIRDPTRIAPLQTIECIITVHVLTFEACCTSLCMCMYTLLILTALIGYTCARLHCYERFQSSDWHHRSRSEQKS